MDKKTVVLGTDRIEQEWTDGSPPIEKLGIPGIGVTGVEDAEKPIEDSIVVTLPRKRKIRTERNTQARQTKRRGC